MTEDQERGMDDVAKIRRMVRTAGLQMQAHGVDPLDVALGFTFAAFDHAECVMGEGIPSVEWLRTVCDVLEKSVFAGAPRSQS